MQYLGGKSRIARWLHSVIAPYAKGRYTYLEPFLGGGNSFKALSHLCPTSCASDNNEDLMLLWKAVSGGWRPPVQLSKIEYEALRHSPPSALRTFAGFGCSFGGKWFAGYASNRRGDDYCGASARNVVSLASCLKGAELQSTDYRYWRPETEWLVYCDPPYKGTEPYGKEKFDHRAFWETCREWSERGALVFISEYAAPPDFVCIAEKPTKRTLSAQDDNRRVVVEKVFVGGLKLTRGGLK